MKTLAQAALVALAVSGSARAGPDGDLPRTFATCTGRLSAVMEHQWLLSLPAADETEARRAQMIALLDSVMIPGTGPQILARRIEAKAAMTALLTRVTFNRDAADSRRAAGQVDLLLSVCNGMLLG